MTGNGSARSVTNGLVTTAYEYTPRGEVVLERTTIDGAIYDVTTTYDAAGNVRTLTGPSGIATTTDYLGQRPRTVSITGGAAPQAITDLEFYPFGPRTRALLPPYSQDAHANVVTSERSYNLRGQVEHVAVTGPAGLAVLDLTYAYDLTGGGAAPDDPGPDLDRVIDGRDGTQSRLYRYDPLGRLSEAEDLSGAPLFGYGYDAAGNRISSAGPAGSLGYGYEAGSNRLSERTIGTNVLTHYHHDAYGSRDYAGSLPYTTTPTYVYNQAGRIASVTGQLPTPSYTYDAFGRRIKKTASGITTLFFYDAQGRLLEEIAAPAMTGSPVRRYVFVEGELLGIASETRPVGAPAWSAPLVPGWLRPEPGAVIFVIALGLVVLTVPLVRRRPLAAVPVVLVAALSLGDSCPSPPPSFAAVHTDALGTPLAVTATTAASPTSPVVLWRASYEPFGAATVNEDPDNDGHGFVLNVRLPGQYYDFETGLHYNYFRTYDPATGRYLEADPIGQAGGLNPYAYVANRPTGFSDPSGLECFDTVCAAMSRGGGNAQALAEALGLPVAAGVGSAAGQILLQEGKPSPPPSGHQDCPTDPTGNDEVQGAADALADALGGVGKTITNKSGDVIVESSDGDTRVRFDIQNPGRDEPHFHIERRDASGDWTDALPSHRHYFGER